MNPETLALIHLGIAFLLAALSVPLILQKVPMNSYYGVRFPQSFKSNEAWYAINRFGGWMLLLSTVPIFVSGIYGWIRRPDHYVMLGTGVLLGSVMIACLLSYLKARSIDRTRG